jgi:hypothetical protein
LRVGNAFAMLAGIATVLAPVAAQSTVAGATGGQSSAHAPAHSSSISHSHVPGSSSGTSDLYFIKTEDTGSGDVEVHSATAASDYRSGIDVATRFSESDAENPNGGWWQMVGSTLYFIKTRNTGSGYVEIHTATAASGYQSGIDVVTRFGEADASGEGIWHMDGPNLYFIRTDHEDAGAFVDVFSATAASGYKSGTDETTRLSEVDAYSGNYQMSDGNLYFLKLIDVGYVQVHSATASSGFKSGTNELSRFAHPTEPRDWWVMSGPNLYMIKTIGSGSHDVEVHSATAASDYKSGIDVATRFSEADAFDGWWQIGATS